MIGAIIISFLAVIAILAPHITPYDPIELDLENRLSSPDGHHLMGTDNLGRDVFSRIIYGTRISLSMTTVVVVIVMLLGIAMGTTAGYFGGIIDGTIMRVVDLLQAFPNIILALVIAGILGPSLTNVMISPVIVLATLDTGHIILSIVALSFLGLGAQPPIPEWGTMLNEGRLFMETAPHLTIFPGLVIMVVVLALNFLGDGLRDALDPRMKEVIMK